MHRSIPTPDPTAGLTPGPGSSSAYWASINNKIDRDQVSTTLEPLSPRSRATIFFTPDAETESSILQAFNNPRSSLSSIAYDHNTTVEGLSAWMARPDIAHRIHQIRSATAVHLSFGATTDLTYVRQALAIILQEYNDAACHAAGLEEGRGYSAKEHNRRDRETARKACALAMRLATFHLTLRAPASRDPYREVNPTVPRDVAVPPQQPVRLAESTLPAPTERTTPDLPELSDPDLLAQIHQVLAQIKEPLASASEEPPSIQNRAAQAAEVTAPNPQLAAAAPPAPASPTSPTSPHQSSEPYSPSPSSSQTSNLKLPAPSRPPPSHFPPPTSAFPVPSSPSPHARSP